MFVAANYMKKMSLIAYQNILKRDHVTYLESLQIAMEEAITGLLFLKTQKVIDRNDYYFVHSAVRGHYRWIESLREEIARCQTITTMP